MSSETIQEILIWIPILNLKPIILKKGKQASTSIFRSGSVLTGLGMIGDGVLRTHLPSLIHAEPWQKLDAGFAQKLQRYGEF
jgi:hypothetical protein